MTKQTEALKMAIEAFDWERVNKQCNVDILTMVMDFSNGRISQSDLMDAIAYRCQIVLELACKEALQSQNKELSDEELFNLVWKRKELVNEIVNLCELRGAI